jgi:hypothetical protein
MNEPQLIPVYEWKSNHSPAGADLMIIEEPELRAFIRAVTELFGPEQARIAAEDSVDEMELVDTITWTDQARSGLGLDSCLGPARRLNTDVDPPLSLVASTDTKVSPIPSSNCFGPAGVA